jgi:hypothetical protein
MAHAATVVFDAQFERTIELRRAECRATVRRPDHRD